MPEITLDDSDRALLRRCPMDVLVVKNARLTKGDAARMKRIKRLWAAHLVRGQVDAKGDTQKLHITLTEAGARAIGRPYLVTGNA